jgi:hypothetical protein
MAIAANCAFFGIRLAPYTPNEHSKLELLDSYSHVDEGEKTFSRREIY